MNNSLPCGLAFVKVMSEKHPDRPKRSEEENDTPGTESPNAIRYVRTRHVLKTATLHHFPVGEDCDIATLHHSQLVKTATLRHCIIPSWWKLRHCIIASFPNWWKLRHCIIASFPVGEHCDIATLHHSQLVLLRHCELRHPANFASSCSYSQPRPPLFRRGLKIWAQIGQSDVIGKNYDVIVQKKSARLRRAFFWFSSDFPKKRCFS